MKDQLATNPRPVALLTEHNCQQPAPTCVPFREHAICSLEAAARQMKDSVVLIILIGGKRSLLVWRVLSEYRHKLPYFGAKIFTVRYVYVHFITRAMH